MVREKMLAGGGVEKNVDEGFKKVWMGGWKKMKMGGKVCLRLFLSFLFHFHHCQCKRGAAFFRTCQINWSLGFRGVNFLP